MALRVRTFAAIVASALLAGCASHLSSMMAGGTSPLPLAFAPTVDALSETALPSGHLPDCTQPTRKLPGTYIFLDAQGDVKNGAHLTTGGRWSVERVTPATPPSANLLGKSTTPTQPVYVYFGSYHLRKAGQTGCVYLVTSVDGGPLMGQNNSVFTAQPDFDTDFFNATTVKAGGLVVNIRGLTSSGGHGVVTLKQGGRTYDTGTMTLIGRMRRQAPAPAVRLVRPNYAFSCKTSDYMHTSLVVVKAGVEAKFPDYRRNGAEDQYFAVFGFCGVNDSFLGPDLVTAVQGYSSYTQYTRATFAPGYPWNSNPHVALWEEDWLWAWVRAAYRDQHITLVGVRE